MSWRTVGSRAICRRLGILVVAVLVGTFGRNIGFAQTCGTDYTIKEGETLAQIAGRVYGNPTQWIVIFNPMYFGFDGARSRFLKFFPGGFHSAHYASMERDYNVAAKTLLEATAPLEKALDGSGFGEAVLAVFRKLNLLSPFEKTRLQGVLRGPAADHFIRAAARFTLGDTKTELLEMEVCPQAA